MVQQLDALPHMFSSLVLQAVLTWFSCCSKDLVWKNHYDPLRNNWHRFAVQRHL